MGQTTVFGPRTSQKKNYLKHIKFYISRIYRDWSFLKMCIKLIISFFNLSYLGLNLHSAEKCVAEGTHSKVLFKKKVSFLAFIFSNLSSIPHFYIIIKLLWSLSVKKIKLLKIYATWKFKLSPPKRFLRLFLNFFNASIFGKTFDLILIKYKHNAINKF